tara:strand:+ start:1099 stop:1800 length:702 start_codon:yes stop_codon:yes gene_type:complete
MINKNSKYIKNIFENVSYKYDFFNNLFSLGLHFLWKRKLISLLEPKNGEEWADLCCGTGDMTFLLNKKVFPNGEVLGIDISDELLKIAKKKATNLKNNVIYWKKKDIFDLDSELRKFDGICMSYGLRNLKNVEDGIQKVFLLLKDNGRAGFLDFNHSKKRSFTSIFQKLYLRLVVVPISGLFNLKVEYSYIEKSIKEFPKGKELIYIAENVGFKDVEYITLFGGQMGILLLEK